MLIYLCRWAWPTGRYRAIRRWNPRTTRCDRVSRWTGASRKSWWATLVLCVINYTLLLKVQLKCLMVTSLYRSSFLYVGLSGIKKCPTVMYRQRNTEIGLSVTSIPRHVTSLRYIMPSRFTSRYFSDTGIPRISSPASMWTFRLIWGVRKFEALTITTVRRSYSRS